MRVQSPPPYSAPAPKKSKTGLIIGLVIGGVVVCCGLPIAGVVGLGMFGLKAGKGVANCAITFAKVRDAAVKYAAANDGKMPPAKNWTAELRTYIPAGGEEEKAMQSILGKTEIEGDAWGCTEGTTKTGLVYNSDAVGKKLSDLKAKDVVLFFETSKRTANAVAAYKAPDPATSPKVFDKPRGWFSIDANGDAKVNGPNGSQPINVRTRRGIGG